MSEEESKFFVEYLLNRPLIIKLLNMQQIITVNVEHILKKTQESTLPLEDARLNGQLYAFSVCNALLQTILALEQTKCGCGSSFDPKEKNSSKICMNCKRKVVG